MRVPIYAPDLLIAQGLACMTKVLQCEWPGSEPLPLTAAQQLLSRGLGYRDFLDLTQSVLEEHSREDLISQDSARDSLSTAIYTHWQSSNLNDIDQDDLQRLVMSLPLDEMVAFGAFQTPSLHGEHAPSTQVAQVAQVDDDMKAPPISASPPASSEAALISESELRRIRGDITTMDNLRDRCLFMLLLTGRRANEIKLARFRDIVETEYGSIVQIQLTKAHHKNSISILPPGFLDAVKLYKREANLSDDDLLFPSSTQAGTPMTAYEMNKTIVSYLRHTVSNPALRSAQVLRRSINLTSGQSNEAPLPEMFKIALSSRHSLTFLHFKKPKT
ncbi:hypothetical protein AO066_05220 [Pseudomonas fluorescens]|nr:hypothetical protein AO066_05220 [Pseudomonas fluorescens]RMP73601.1 hypothetical protein ALQ17_04467 [Pseudomonas fluorescens]